MKVQGSYTFAAPQEVVWSVLRDPDMLSRVIPGCEQLDEIDENQYQGILKLKVGPVQGKFKGDVALTDIVDPASYNIRVDGKGAPGFVKGTGSLYLETDGETTVLHYDGDAQVGGRLASVGQRLLDTSAKAIIRQSLEGMGQQIQAKMMASASPHTNGAAQEVPPVAPPSQMQFAAGVAKNMFAEMVPPDQREDFFTRLVLILGGIVLFRIVSEWWMNRLAHKIAKRINK